MTGAIQHLSPQKAASKDSSQLRAKSESAQSRCFSGKWESIAKKNHSNFFNSIGGGDGGRLVGASFADIDHETQWQRGSCGVYW